ncbi:hypothetical protein HHK36_014298 [Tetracentron sinense]|uniref:Uncharacterized protein n=1 Tax=Tetracentron sinense TaxID=13715 RepID=A0A834Z7W8_TETSI|nr:hypothetical protein HHK36_014298 [Tetracentron sinense]
MEESGTLPEYDDAAGVAGKGPRTPAIFDDDEDFLDGFWIEEEMVEEVMKELEEEISCTTNINNPFSSPTILPSSSSFVTINGNEESCGPSFSDSASTVMASIDMCGISVSYFTGPTEEFSGVSVGFPAPENVCCRPEVGEEVTGEGMDGCDCDEVNDEWVARVLNGAIEFEDWT